MNATQTKTTPGNAHKTYRQRQMARIHMARKELGLTEEAYREILIAKTGKHSCADMDAQEHKIILGHLGLCGAPSAADPKHRRPHWPERDTRPLYLAVRAKCFNLGVGEKYALEILKRTHGKRIHGNTAPDKLEWASDEALQGVLAALRNQEMRLGIAP